VQVITTYLSPFLDGLPALGLLVFRIVWGITLITHGLPKLKNLLHWMESGEPIVLPSSLQAIGAFTLLGGGIAIVVGFLTPLVALGLAAAMSVALYGHLVTREPFIKPTPNASGDSYEASLVYLVIALLFIAIGPGIFSLDYLFFGHLSPGGE
jgi:putative oxidoreductase